MMMMMMVTTCPYRGREGRGRGRGGARGHIRRLRRRHLFGGERKRVFHEIPRLTLLTGCCILKSLYMVHSVGQ
jgi:hypothetical protein